MGRRYIYCSKRNSNWPLLTDEQTRISGSLPQKYESYQLHAASHAKVLRMLSHFQSSLCRNIENIIYSETGEGYQGCLGWNRIRYTLLAADTSIDWSRHFAKFTCFRTMVTQYFQKYRPVMDGSRILWFSFFFMI